MKQKQMRPAVCDATQSSGLGRPGEALRSRPEVDLDEMENPHVASVEVMILWGTNVLHVQHLTPPRAFYVGEEPGPKSACDYVVPAEKLGATRAPIVLADGKAIRCIILPHATGSIELPGQAAMDLCEAVRSGRATPSAELPGSYEMVMPMGARARIEANGLVFQVAAVAAGRPVPTGMLASLDSRVPLFTGLSLMAHLALIGLMAFFTPPLGLGDDPIENPDRLYSMQKYLQAAAERAAEERSTEGVAESNADEGGLGVRAAGKQGSMGSPHDQWTEKRFGVEGPRDDPDPRGERVTALREAAEFGMIGLLDGGGGDREAPKAPWGREDSMSARGNLWGDSSDGGLGLSGIGEGSGGGWQGGGLAHTGAGTGTGQGFGSGHGRLDVGQASRLRDGVVQIGGQLPALSAPSGLPPASSPSAAPGNGREEPADKGARAAGRSPIDPNGRFSTTYRPGHGHLAAFEAAVARGVVPVAARELVSDVGARYAPSLSEPRDKVLGHAVHLERTALPPGGGAVHLRISLRSSSAEARVHPRRAVSLLLDVSGSMAGEPLSRAKEAAEHLVDQLAPTDDFSLITFANSARIVVPNGPVGPRRSAIHQAIAQANDGGGTNIGEALDTAYQQARRGAGGADVIPVVMLLSDGQPTIGVCDQRVLSSAALGAFQNGIQTSTFGLGTEYDGVLMSSLASDGAGGYYYLRDADQIASAFRSELEQRLDPAASAVEIRVRLARDVALLHVYGSSRLGAADAARERAKEIAADEQAAARRGMKRDRLEDVKGGMRFLIPAFSRSDSYSLLMQVAVPPGTGSRSVGMFELKYKDLVNRRNVAEESRIGVTFAANDAASARSIDPSVMRTVQGHLAGEDLMAASKLIATGETIRAMALLHERESILRTAANTLGEPAFLLDATRFSRLLSHTQDGELSTQPYALAMVLETASRSHLQ